MAGIVNLVSTPRWVIDISTPDQPRIRQKQLKDISEVLKFGQLCYWVKKLFTVHMPSEKLSHDAFHSLKNLIKHTAPGALERLPSLDGQGNDDPAALLEALPLDETQKTPL